MVGIKILAGIAAILGIGLVVVKLSRSPTSPLSVFVAPGSRFGNGYETTNELFLLENVVRNATNATVELIGAIYPNCVDKSSKVGTVLLRDFGNGTREVWLVFQLLPERMVDAGLLKVRVFFNSTKLYTTHHDLCKKFRPALACPISTERQTYGLQYPLPRHLIPGKYDVELWTTDQKDHTFACLTATLTLLSQ